MSQPFFSIVIPVYNRTDMFLRSLKLLLEQTFQSYEIIIIDDGSKDNVESIVSHEIKTNISIKVIRQENAERGAARNRGIRNSKGEYVVIFDSDDFMHNNHLAVLHNGIIANNYPDFIATKFNFIDTNDKTYTSDVSKLQPGKYDYKLFLSGNPLACNICLKRNNPDLIYFEEDRNYAIKEDWMFLISNLRKSEVIILPETTISMYDHEGRSMRSGNQAIINKTLMAVEWIKNKVNLSTHEINRLEAHKNYFCGIHAYLDGDRTSAIKYSIGSIRKGGIRMKYLSLLLKSILGRKLILKLK
jgi:glycosyltransferase involved in cell wall biosynthesis